MKLTEEQNACGFRKLGIRGGNETRGQFLSALLIEMVLIKGFLSEKGEMLQRDPLSFKPSNPESSKRIFCSYSK